MAANEPVHPLRSVVPAPGTSTEPTSTAVQARGRTLAALLDDAAGYDPLQLLTADEVAALLKVKPSWVYAEARSGRLRKVPVGKHTRFFRWEVARYLTAAFESATPA